MVLHVRGPMYIPSSSSRTVLHATLAKEYQPLDHFSGGPLVLKASSQIAAFLPLVVHQVGDGNAFGGYWFDSVHAAAYNQLENLNSLHLVPATHIDVTLCGGPEPREKGAKFIENMETLDEGYGTDGVLVLKLSTRYWSPYRISCQRLGNFKLLFFVGEENHNAVKAEAEILLACRFPDSIVVIADEAVNAPAVIWAATQADRNSARIHATPITVANGRITRLSTVGISDTGNAFANSSSLNLGWETNNCDGLGWDDMRTKSSWERFLVLQNSSGFCVVRTTAVGFDDTMKGQNSATPFECSKTVLTDAIRLQLVSALRLSPDFSLLLFRPAAKLSLSITGGSCFLDTVVNDTQILEVMQSTPNSECSQLVLFFGGWVLHL